MDRRAANRAMSDAVMLAGNGSSRGRQLQENEGDLRSGQGHPPPEGSEWIDAHRCWARGR